MMKLRDIGAPDIGDAHRAYRRPDMRAKESPVAGNRPRLELSFPVLVHEGICAFRECRNSSRGLSLRDGVSAVLYRPKQFLGLPPRFIRRKPSMLTDRNASGPTRLSILSDIDFLA